MSTTKSPMVASRFFMVRPFAYVCHWPAWRSCEDSAVELQKFFQPCFEYLLGGSRTTMMRRGMQVRQWENQSRFSTSTSRHGRKVLFQEQYGRSG